MPKVDQPGALERDRAGRVLLADKPNTYTADTIAEQGHCRTTRLRITARLLPDGMAFSVQGRDAWALMELIRAGQKGCTPIDHPSPRWSAYVLKRKHGLDIETVYEPHCGDFPGNHARYVLRSVVEIISRNDG